MRKIAVSLIITTVFFIFGCIKTEHSVRVRNYYSEDISNISIGPASFGSIKSGNTSSSKVINEGSNSISGSTSNGQIITGSISVDGAGKHDWTVTISSSGGSSIKED